MIYAVRRGSYDKPCIEVLSLTNIFFHMQTSFDNWFAVLKQALDQVRKEKLGMDL